jgi:hypothetical protein
MGHPHNWEAISGNNFRPPICIAHLPISPQLRNMIKIQGTDHERALIAQPSQN